MEIEKKHASVCHASRNLTPTLKDIKDLNEGKNA
jgi:hypothetical protein